MMEEKKYTEHIYASYVTPYMDVEEEKRLTKLTDKEFAVFMWGFENGMEKNPQKEVIFPFLMGMLVTFGFIVLTLVIMEGVKHGL